MNKTTKLVSGLVLLTLVLGFVLYDHTAKRNETLNQPVTNKPVTIGAIYTFTGSGADVGQAHREGTNIAVEEINKNGGIHGRQVQVIYEDAPNATANNLVNAAHKLIEQDKVTAILDYPYSGLGAIQGLAAKNRVPIIDVIDGSDEVASFGDWIFSTGIYTDGVGAHVARFAHESLHVRKAAILAGQDEYLIAVAGGFEREFVKSNGQITSNDKFTIGDTDFKTQLSKIIQSGAEAIFVSQLGEGGTVVKQARELGYKGIFLGSDTFSIADVARVAGDHINDSVYFALWQSFDANTPQQNDFAAHYKEKYRKEPGDYLFYNVLGYDGMMVLAEAMRRSDLSGESIKNELYKIKDHPGLGGPITIDQTGINRDPKSVMATYKDGKMVQYVQ